MEAEGEKKIPMREEDRSQDPVLHFKSSFGQFASHFAARKAKREQ